MLREEVTLKGQDQIFNLTCFQKVLDSFIYVFLYFSTKPTLSSSSLLATSINPFSSKLSTVFMFSSFSRALDTNVFYLYSNEQRYRTIKTFSHTPFLDLVYGQLWGSLHMKDKLVRRDCPAQEKWYISKSQRRFLTWSEICACSFWISAFSDMFSLCKACPRKDHRW